MYDDCQESCRNLVPVQKVVYNVLRQLENKFDLPLLEALFTEVNRQEYPELNNIYKSFENAIHEKLCYQESDGEETVENLNTPLSLEQGVPRGQEARTENSQASDMDITDIGRNSTLEKHSGKRSKSE
ncbi:hypothetical protein HJG60_010704 [Phyllostomus discolor]|uniref:HSR domain-containing protein n=1 Tax=Phyllostomus discolor TaxID=89673 RepID=A0A834ALV4_9CHIR|nr:hypothetical protein HJG60_010704 [Phyllostomus discolor]